MAGRLDGKVAVITGGCSGIGLGTVELFVAEGARVIAADVQAEKGEMLEKRFPDKVRFVRCDVTREHDVEKAIGTAETAFGALDVLFNNAGVATMSPGIEAQSADAWDAQFALLVRGPMLGMKHAVPAMRRRGGGSIVNTASVAGLQAGFGPLAYSVAKAAVIHLTRVAAAELGREKIRVNAICPGLIATSIFGASAGLPREVADQMAARVESIGAGVQPIPKPGLPADIANACLFLASDASAFVTGTHLLVDGGITVGPQHAWRPDAESPLLAALGITAEQAQQMAAAQRSG